MNIQPANKQDRDELIALLQSQKLPAHDLPAVLDDFYIVKEEEQLIAAIGMERYAQYGLLRSMVVHPDHRNKQLAGALVEHLETSAKDTGITIMYLLTETAAKYFEKKGYSYVERAHVPAVLKQSSEFSHVCPASATIMMKDLHTVKLELLAATSLTNQLIN
ncbi:arsenic resistance N-acetyltransferase ArsN2 [Aridibaculum aurantiacum]|uniref:arsenic resistance N-acetyltransferase ArsN2 n=1 Tax=Aridibaculum aurantiacum TaxID=2810307 RepID=UPI001A966E9E|nr:arsenic resistance N-acetyltransferase ArsN2 [Aridibaculum aurantiacum]